MAHPHRNRTPKYTLPIPFSRSQKHSSNSSSLSIENIQNNLRILICLKQLLKLIHGRNHELFGPQNVIKLGQPRLLRWTPSHHISNMNHFFMRSRELLIRKFHPKTLPLLNLKHHFPRLLRCNGVNIQGHRLPHVPPQHLRKRFRP